MIKSAATILAGTGGIGVVSPIVYVVSTQPFHKTLWNRHLEKTEALINCVSPTNKKYDLEVDLAETDEADFGLGITLKAWTDRETGRVGSQMSWNHRGGGRKKE